MDEDSFILKKWSSKLIFDVHASARLHDTQKLSAQPLTIRKFAAYTYQVDGIKDGREIEFSTF